MHWLAYLDVLFYVEDVDVALEEIIIILGEMYT